ncbi:AAA family ATPase [Saccharopolyspora hattusasensis]|uniref:AAA family ATPase n=1 Tax=Saccharopolyspora hattusasensis TaxID=1128679 RepID=UPI003D99F27C
MATESSDLPSADWGVGEIGRARASIAALEAAQRLVKPGVDASDADLQVLRGFSGWGPLAKALGPEPEGAWAQMQGQLLALLSPEEYGEGFFATPNAFYTPPLVADRMHQLLRDLGFSGGTVLEPGCGTGMFLDRTPADLRSEIAWVGVEKDPSTARIASLLHPEATIRASALEETSLPLAEAVLGNVPFEDVAVHEVNPEVPESVTANLHNYAIWRAVDALAPGGVAVLVTTCFTLDGKTPLARLAIAKQADLLGALRLPSGALSEGGTEVPVDVLVLRKRLPGEQAPELLEDAPAWVRSVPHPALDGAHVNAVFHQHPEWVLGEMVPQNAQAYGRTMRVVGPQGAELVEAFERAAGEIVASARAQDRVFAAVRRDQAAQVPDVPLADAEGRKEGSFHIRDGRAFQVTGGVLAPVMVQDRKASKQATDKARAAAKQRGEDPGEVAEVRVDKGPMTGKALRELTALVRVRDAAAELLEAEADHSLPDDALEPLRERLNTRYDAYQGEFGFINRATITVATETPKPGADNSDSADEQTGLPKVTRRRPSMGGFAADPDYPLVLSLEDFDDASNTGKKAAIFHRRVNRPRPRLERAENPEHALTISLDETGRVDLDRIGELLDTAPHAVPEALGELIFFDPAALAWQQREEYLAGDVVSKLELARSAHDADPERYQRNVTALEGVQPTPLTPEEITASLGAVWIPPDVVEEFVREVLKMRVDIEFEPQVSQWNLTQRSDLSVAAAREWGTSRINGVQLVELALTGRTPKIKDTTADDKKITNPAETQAAVTKQQELRARFADWAWEDPQRADRLCGVYNRQFNSFINRSYEGAHLTFPGLDPGFDPYAHQREMVHRILSNPSQLCGHDVGGGKTATMFMSALKLRELGLARKPLFVVPNHLLEQIVRDGKRLFPGAKILMADERQLGKRTNLYQRKLFAARCATGDWDAVVMTHSAFESLPVTPGTQATYLAEHTSELEDALRCNPNPKSRRTKALAKALKREQVTLKAGLGAHRADDGAVTFEMLGCDYLLVDEAHYFKNLHLRANNPEISLPKGSNRATDLDNKLAYLRRTNPTGRVATFFTGTPLSNNPVEIYVMQHYLQPERLKQMGVANFDLWLNTFIRIDSRLEVGTDGVSFRLKDRPVGFRNPPELMGAYNAIADVRDAKKLGLKRPAGRFENVLIPPTAVQRDYIEDITGRIDSLATTPPYVDNMLKICSDGRKAALDPELVGLIDPEPGKVERVVATMSGIYERTQDRQWPDGRVGSLQLGFLDQGTPSNDHGDQVYGKIRDGLINAGVPAHKVRFIHEANTTAQKATLFAQCRSGDVAVLLGSTDKMGVGTNVQDLIVALHHIDAPWRPADVAQRDGRGLRVGNMMLDLGEPVEIYKYITERSFDAFMWQTLERKAWFIAQLFSGSPSREDIDIDLDETVLQMHEAKALASGNPLLLEQAEVKQEVTRLQRLATSHARTQRALDQDIENWRYGQRVLRQKMTTAHQLARRTDSSGWQRRGQPLDEDKVNGVLGELLTASMVGRSSRGHDRISYQGIPVTIRARQVLGAWHLNADLSSGGLGTVALRPEWVSHANQYWRITKAISDAVDQAADRVADLQADHDALERQIEQGQAQLGKPFPHAAELQSARERVASIESQMENGDTEPTPATDNQPADAADEQAYDPNDVADLVIQDAGAMAGLLGGDVQLFVADRHLPHDVDLQTVDQDEELELDADDARAFAEYLSGGQPQSATAAQQQTTENRSAPAGPEVELLHEVPDVSEIPGLTQSLPPMVVDGETVPASTPPATETAATDTAAVAGADNAPAATAAEPDQQQPVHDEEASTDRDRDARKDSRILSTQAAPVDEAPDPGEGAKAEEPLALALDIQAHTERPDDASDDELARTEARRIAEELWREGYVWRREPGSGDGAVDHDVRAVTTDSTHALPDEVQEADALSFEVYQARVALGAQANAAVDHAQALGELPKDIADYDYQAFWLNYRADYLGIPEDLMEREHDLEDHPARQADALRRTILRRLGELGIHDGAPEATATPAAQAASDEADRVGDQPQQAAGLAVSGELVPARPVPVPQTKRGRRMLHLSREHGLMMLGLVESHDHPRSMFRDYKHFENRVGKWEKIETGTWRAVGSQGQPHTEDLLSRTRDLLVRLSRSYHIEPVLDIYLDASLEQGAQRLLDRGLFADADVRTVEMVPAMERGPAAAEPSTDPAVATPPEPTPPVEPEMALGLADSTGQNTRDVLDSRVSAPAGEEREQLPQEEALDFAQELWVQGYVWRRVPGSGDGTVDHDARVITTDPTWSPEAEGQAAHELKDAVVRTREDAEHRLDAAVDRARTAGLLPSEVDDLAHRADRLDTAAFRDPRPDNLLDNAPSPADSLASAADALRAQALQRLDELGIDLDAPAGEKELEADASPAKVENISPDVESKGEDDRQLLEAEARWVAEQLWRDGYVWRRAPGTGAPSIDHTARTVITDPAWSPEAELAAADELSRFANQNRTALIRKAETETDHAAQAGLLPVDVSALLDQADQYDEHARLDSPPDDLLDREPAIEEIPAARAAALRQQAMRRIDEIRRAPAEPAAVDAVDAVDQDADAKQSSAVTAGQPLGSEATSSAEHTDKDTEATAQDSTNAEAPVTEPAAEEATLEAGWAFEVDAGEDSAGITVQRWGRLLVVSGTDPRRDPPRVRKVLKDHKFRWRPEDQRWEYYGRVRDRDAAEVAVRSMVAEVNAAQQAASAPSEMTFPPTAQQQEILDAVERAVASPDPASASVAVKALAGTGKTTTLRMMAEAHPTKRITYICFNATIAAEAREKMPRNVTAVTMHALARRQLANGPFGDKIARMNRGEGARWPRDVAAALGVTDPVPYGDDELLEPERLGALVLHTLKAYRDSADRQITTTHLASSLRVPKGPGQIVLDYARNAWEDIASPNGRLLAFSHDDYQKIWALSNPEIRADLLFFDEAQDINPVQEHVVQQQGMPTVVVGDSHQAIYGFRGARDALRTWPATEVLPLTQSWRFGPEVAALGNRFLTLLRADLRLEGNPALDSRLEPVEDPNAILCRTNIAAINAVADGLSAGKRVALAGGGGQIREIARAARDLQRGKPTKHPDLSGFADWQQVREYATEHDVAWLLTFVRLVDRHTPDGLIDMVDELVDEHGEPGPDLVVSTAHKAKGREWDTVRIADDFRAPTTDENDELQLPAPDELRLSYVTVTRGKLRTELGSLDWILDLDHAAPETSAAHEAVTITQQQDDVLDTSDEAATIAATQPAETAERARGIAREARLASGDPERALLRIALERDEEVSSTVEGTVGGTVHTWLMEDTASARWMTALYTSADELVCYQTSATLDESVRTQVSMQAAAEVLLLRYTELATLSDQWTSSFLSLGAPGYLAQGRHVAVRQISSLVYGLQPLWRAPLSDRLVLASTDVRYGRHIDHALALALEFATSPPLVNEVVAGVLRSDAGPRNLAVRLSEVADVLELAWAPPVDELSPLDPAAPLVIKRLRAVSSRLREASATPESLQAARMVAELQNAFLSQDELRPTERNSSGKERVRSLAWRIPTDETSSRANPIALRLVRQHLLDAKPDPMFVTDGVTAALQNGPDEVVQALRGAIQWLDTTRTHSSPLGQMLNDAGTGVTVTRLEKVADTIARRTRAERAATSARTVQGDVDAELERDDPASTAVVDGEVVERSAAQATGGVSWDSTLQAARAWSAAGVSVIPVCTDGSKAPALKSWTEFQQRRPTDAELLGWFGEQDRYGIGLVCGAVSGDLEMIEFEGRAVAEGLFEQWSESVLAGSAELYRQVVEQGLVVRSPSGGYHLLVRVEGGVEGNQRLAAREATDTELTAAERDTVASGGRRPLRVLAETRGEHGMVVAAGSPPGTHASGQAWEIVTGHPGSLPVITAAQRDQLHISLRALDRRPAPEPIPTPAPTSAAEGELTPGRDFDVRGSWHDVLEPHGWTAVSTQGNATYWRRPGKTRGISAVTGGDHGDYLWVFSTSTVFDSEHAYSKWRAYAVVKHGGDFSAAASDLRRQGYGSQPERHLQLHYRQDAGVVLYGTQPSDALSKVFREIKRSGQRPGNWWWSDNIHTGTETPGAWYIVGTRDRPVTATTLECLATTAEQLRSRGFTVDVDVQLGEIDDGDARKRASLQQALDRLGLRAPAGKDTVEENMAAARARAADLRQAARAQFEEALRTITPQGLTTYLTTRGWTEVDDHGYTRARMFIVNVGGEEVDVLVPDDPQVRNYPRRMLEALDGLETAELEMGRDWRTIIHDLAHSVHPTPTSADPASSYVSEVVDTTTKVEQANSTAEALDVNQAAEVGEQQALIPEPAPVEPDRWPAPPPPPPMTMPRNAQPRPKSAAERAHEADLVALTDTELQHRWDQLVELSREAGFTVVVREGAVTGLFPEPGVIDVGAATEPLRWAVEGLEEALAWHHTGQLLDDAVPDSIDLGDLPPVHIAPDALNDGLPSRDDDTVEWAVTRFNIAAGSEQAVYNALTSVLVSAGYSVFQHRDDTAGTDHSTREITIPHEASAAANAAIARDLAMIVQLCRTELVHASRTAAADGEYERSAVPAAPRTDRVEAEVEQAERGPTRGAAQRQRRTLVLHHSQQHGLLLFGTQPGDPIRDALHVARLQGHTVGNWRWEPTAITPAGTQGAWAIDNSRGRLATPRTVHVLRSAAHALTSTGVDVRIDLAPADATEEATLALHRDQDAAEGGQEPEPVARSWSAQDHTEWETASKVQFTDHGGLTVIEAAQIDGRWALRAQSLVEGHHLDVRLNLRDEERAADLARTLAGKPTLLPRLARHAVLRGEASAELDGSPMPAAARDLRQRLAEPGPYATSGRDQDTPRRSAARGAAAALTQPVGKRPGASTMPGGTNRPVPPPSRPQSTNQTVSAHRPTL